MSEQTKTDRSGSALTWAIVIAILTVSIPILIVDLEADDAALTLAKTWAFSAAVVAMVAAFVRVLAHDVNKEMDLFGKMLSVPAAALAAFTAGLWLFFGIG